MNDPHLLPDQIDLLVDGDAGPDVTALRSHLDGCEPCRARYDAARRSAEAVEALPHFTPRLPFADQIMSKVERREPWHETVAARATRLVPPRGPLRLVSMLGAGVGALGISAVAFWMLLRWDLTAWLVNLGIEQGRRVAVAGVSGFAAEALGAPASAALARGELWPVLLTVALLALSVLLAGLGFRRLAATARAKRG